MPAASSGAKAASRSAVAAPAGPEPTMPASRRSTNALLAPRDGPRHCPRPSPLTAPVARGGSSGSYRDPDLAAVPRQRRELVQRKYVTRILIDVLVGRGDAAAQEVSAGESQFPELREVRRQLTNLVASGRVPAIDSPWR